MREELQKVVDNMTDLFSEAVKEMHDEANPNRQAWKSAEAKADQDDLSAASAIADQQYQNSGLQEKNITNDNYDLASYVKDGNSLTPVDDSISLPNKYITKDQVLVAGRDLASGSRTTRPLVDSDGFAESAKDDLYLSSQSSAGVTPTENGYPLAKIALQANKEGKGISGYKNSVPQNTDDPSHIIGLGVATRANDAEKFMRYVTTGDYRRAKQPDNIASPPEAPKMTVDQLAVDKNWLGATEYVLSKMLGGAKESDVI